MNTNGWNEYQKMVLSDLKEIKTMAKENANKINSLDRSIGQLEAKAAIWGGIAGLLIGGIITVIIKLF